MARGNKKLSVIQAEILAKIEKELGKEAVERFYASQEADKMKAKEQAEKEAQATAKTQAATLIKWIKDTSRTPAQIRAMFFKMEAEIAYAAGTRNRPGKGSKTKAEDSTSIEAKETEEQAEKELESLSA